MTASAVGLRGTQVAAQLPLPSDFRDSAGSPFENVVTTDPAVMEFAQSSTTRTSMAAGKPAGTLKLAPSMVKTGSSFVGVQAGVVARGFACGLLAGALGRAAAGATTSSTSIGWMES